MEDAHQNKALKPSGPSALELKRLEIERVRSRLHTLVDQNVDAFLQRLAHDQTADGPLSLPLDCPSARFKGKKPIAVLFPDGREVVTPTWKKAVTAILRDCNADPVRHERLLYLRGRVNGNFRSLLASASDGMDAPLMIDDELYLESKFDTEALLNVLTKKLLDAVGYDYHGITLMCRIPRQRMNVPDTPEQTADGQQGQGMEMQM